MRKRDPNRIEMGRRFREARERLNWSREVLAERADVSVSFIADLELGNTGTRLENFIRLCRLRDLNADYVLFGAPGDAVQRITDLLRDRDEETVRVALARSARFRRRLAPLRRDLAAGAAGSAVPAGSSASCGALWAGAGSAVSAGFAAARLRRFPGLDAALFSGAGEGAAASWTGGGVSRASRCS